MGEIVGRWLMGRWLKKGNHKTFSTQFETSAGAKRAAEQKAKKAGSGFEAGKPFRHGAHYNVYIHKK